MDKGPHARRLLMSSDAAGYGRGTDKRHEDFQSSFVAAHERAAAAVGVNRDEWHKLPGGDGELALIPASQPEPVVVDGYMRELAAALRERNAGRPLDERLRLRVAMHFGVAYPAANGVAGQAPVEVSRLVQWAPLKRVLAESADVNLILILSDRLFVETVKQGHTTYKADEFHRVSVQEKEFKGTAWVWSPDCDVRLFSCLTEREPGSAKEPVASHGHTFTQNASVINTFAASVDAREANFGAIGERDKR